MIDKEINVQQTEERERGQKVCGPLQPALVDKWYLTNALSLEEKRPVLGSGCGISPS